MSEVGQAGGADSALIDRSPESALRWYKYLRKCPMARYPRRVFPLKGSGYRGAWECEVTSGDRLYYLPDEAAKKVVVDRKSTRLNSSHLGISYAVFSLK